MNIQLIHKGSKYLCIISLIEWGWTVWNWIFRLKEIFSGTHTQNILQRFQRTNDHEVLMSPMTVNVSENNDTARNALRLHKKSIPVYEAKLSPEK